MRIIILLLLTIFLIACGEKETAQETKIHTVSEDTYASHLYYTGNIKPIKSQVIVSQVEGVILEKVFDDGMKVKKGQLLFVLASSKFINDYKAALTQYIKAKSDFDNNQLLLNEAEFLHKNELISEDDYKMKQSGFYSSRLGLLQASDSIKHLLEIINVKNFDLNKLSIANMDKITEAMHLQQISENLRFYAPIDGVVLAPQKSEQEAKKINKGDMVKEGDALAVIGDMNGLMVQIKVNELIVNQLKPKQPVSITGIGFPDLILQGEIASVNKQADLAAGGLPTFNVDIIIPTLPEKAKTMIHVGMSASVDIVLEQEAKIMIPIASIEEEQGVTYVRKLDAKSKQQKKIAITTGKSSQTNVVVLSGLQKGDQIVIPDRTQKRF